MPLLIPSRPPNPFFTQQRRRTLPVIAKTENEPDKSDNDSLRLMPLDSDTQTRAGGHKATPVGPLQHPHHSTQRSQGQQINRGHGNTLGQPEFSMAAPTMPRPGQPHSSVHGTGVPSAPPGTGQQSSPEQAAQKFRRVNQSLPDGVRYEPLDEDTMRLLRDNGHLPAASGTGPSSNPLSVAPGMGPPTSPATPRMGLTASPAAPGMPSHSTSSPATSPQSLVSQHTAPPVGTHPSAGPAHSQPTYHDQDKIIKILHDLIQDERNAHVFYFHLATTVTVQHMVSGFNDIASDCLSHIRQLSHVLSSQFGSNFTPVETEINTGLELQNALALALVEENRLLRILAELLDTVSSTESEKIIQRVINKKIVNYNHLASFRVIE